MKNEYCWNNMLWLTRVGKIFTITKGTMSVDYFEYARNSFVEASPFLLISDPNIKSAEESSIEWTWDVKSGNDFVNTLNNDRDVTFHRKHSSGTALVRGSKPMSHGQHFWEIQMISPVYGTDMMVGIGTAEADMSQLQNTYISRLGKDSDTWGFSYTGSFYHNGEERTISTTFDQGSIIGLHLDLWNGTLSFYKNRKHLGVASRGLNGKTLYAMASSTAACSSMRLLKSCSFPSCLQFLCCVRLRDLIPDEKCVLNELDIPPGLKLFLEKNLSWLLSPRCVERHPRKDQKTVTTPEQHSSGRNFIIVGSRGIPYACNHLQQKVTVNMESCPKSNEDDLSESGCKRPRYSSNYVVGLSSDPDSESEM
ncbi:SPRY domain-containing SOCS box protein 3 isoform X3 [Parasteatoda tepidariorum]|uniref:SPRY domain-containing SOCS box protein 3 isoform X3 n=1 Tax=Parasteatoda tepidariorum TaxID=114398 RepID=UPI001C720E6F|nr:SPRY domain-containing SOCS box protein 3 isoform X1 [Parasteatoda tepidariorum]